MELNSNSVVKKAKGLKTLEAIQANARLGPFHKNVYPLTQKPTAASRTKQKTLGQGSFGRVNLEEVAEGEIATKYFLAPHYTTAENISEVAVLRYLQDLPNVAQMVGLAEKNISGAMMSFPAILMGKAKTTLSDFSILTSWNITYSIFVQILRGYYTLHSQGIVHRDTKPANMLLTNLGEVWISDFGKSRYLDANIPIPKDNYTGTRLYSAPELLMNSQSNYTSRIDYYASDAWAVGVSLLEIILQKKYIFSSGNTSRHGILQAIFDLFGMPNKDDGRLFRIFTHYTTNIAKFSVPSTGATVRNPSRLVQMIKDLSKYKPDNLADLDAIGAIISGLLTYDPEKRMTIAQAIQSLPSHKILPVLRERPSLVSTYMYPLKDISILISWHTTGFLSDDDLKVQLDRIFDTMQRIVYTSSVGLDRSSAHIVLDRLGVYYMSFLKNTYTNGPLTNESTLGFLASVALLISVSLFDTSRGPTQYQSIQDVYTMISNIWPYAVSEKTINIYLRYFMTYPIEYLGSTLLDDCLESLSSAPVSVVNTSALGAGAGPAAVAPGMTQEEKETISLLNFICFQKSIFPLYSENPGLLKTKLLEYVRNPVAGGLTPKLYISTSYIAGVATKTKEEVKHFLAYITPKYKVSKPLSASAVEWVPPSVSSAAVAPGAGNGTGVVVAPAAAPSMKNKAVLNAARALLANARLQEKAPAPAPAPAPAAAAAAAPREPATGSGTINTTGYFSAKPPSTNPNSTLGGGKKKSRRVKKRKTNTALKVRNGVSRKHRRVR
jgi:serine/threonine protein kinase